VEIKLHYTTFGRGSGPDHAGKFIMLYLDEERIPIPLPLTLPSFQRLVSTPKESLFLLLNWYP